MTTRRLKLTKANVTRTLTRGGLPIARYERSRQIRGWGTWYAGFRSNDNFGSGPLKVEWALGDYDRLKDEERAAFFAAKMAQAEPLLQASGWATRREGDGLVVGEVQGER